MNEEEEQAIERLKEIEVNTYAEGKARTIDTILKLIKKLQKKNEELNLKYYMLYTGKIENLKAQEVKIKSQVIPVQKIKDKIEEYKNMLKTCNKAKDIDRIKAINERILELQELLEGRK